MCITEELLRGELDERFRLNRGTNQWRAIDEGVSLDGLCITYKDVALKRMYTRG